MKRRRRGSRFPKRRDWDYLEWCRERIAAGVVCDGCGERRAAAPAHLRPKGSGGYDRNNVAFLCDTCHRKQEKRTAGFERETGRDLRAAARAHTAEYDQRPVLAF